MLSVIARIADKVIVEVTSTDITPAFMEAIAINYGGTAADYTYYTMTPEEEARVDNGDQYALNWEESTIVSLDFSIEDSKEWLEVILSTSSNKVTLNTIDVSRVKVYVEGTKYYQNDLVYVENSILKCQVIESEEKPTADGNWSFEAPAALLTFRILKADKSGVDETVSVTDNLTIKLPDRRADMSLNLDKGVCVKPVVLSSMENCGVWAIPASDRVTLGGVEYKVVDTISFKGLLPY